MTEKSLTKEEIREITLTQLNEEMFPPTTDFEEEAEITDLRENLRLSRLPILP